MDSRHGEIILKNIPSLCQMLKYEKCAKKCLNKNIVSRKMLDIIERQYPAQLHMEQLLRKITCRGPDAFMKFLDILLEETGEFINICSDMCALFEKSI